MKRLKNKAWVLFILCILLLSGGCAASEDKTKKDMKQREELLLWSYYETDNHRSPII